MAQTITSAVLFGGIIADLQAMADHRATCRNRPCRECGMGKCVSCDGDAPVSIGGAMGECDACMGRRQRADALASARATLPVDFDSLRLDSPEFGSRVRTVDGHLLRGALAQKQVVVVGPHGAGKTSVAAALFSEWLDMRERGESPWTDGTAAAMFVSAFALNKARAQHPLGAGESPVIARALRAALVVIDDLGQEVGRVSDDGVREVIHERHAQGMATWVTTFLTAKQAGDKYGGGISRRIYERATVVRLGTKTP